MISPLINNMATYEQTLAQYKNKFAERCQMCNQVALWRTIDWAYKENEKMKKQNHKLMTYKPNSNEPDDYILVKYCPSCREKRKGHWFKVPNGEYHHLENQKSGD